MTTNQAEFDRARKVLVGGVNSAVRAFRAVGGTPRFIDRAEGAYMWDVEGRRYIDYLGSWGPMIAGQSHPRVIEAVQRAAVRGPGRCASSSATSPANRSWPCRRCGPGTWRSRGQGPRPGLPSMPRPAARR